MKLVDALDCGQNEIRNAVSQNLAAAPSSPKPGQDYFNTSMNVKMIFNGTSWRPNDAAALTDGSIQNTALATNPLNRTNHFGSQASATISDLASVVQGYSLDKFLAAAATMNFGNQRLGSIAQALNATDAVRLDQMQAFVAASIQGQTAIKNPARVAATGNIALSGLPVIDGVQVAAGDRVLAPLQTTSTQNGLYIAAAAGWTLAADGNVGTEWAEGTEILIAEGTLYGSSIFRQTTTGAITIGTNALNFVQTAKINTYTTDNVTATMTGMQISVNYGYGLTIVGGKLGVDASKIPAKFSATITGDGTTTAFNITHGLGTTDVIVGLRDSAGNKVFADDNPINSTTLTVTFATAPAASVTYRATIIG